MFNNTEGTKLFWIPHPNEVCMLGERINRDNGINIIATLENTLKVRTVPYNIPNLDSNI